jgi:ribosomal-protein-alanine N-acetyltransferase
MTAADAISFINKVNENIEKKLALYWAITLTGTKTFAGTICLFDFSTPKNSCEIGYELVTKFQGQGIMKEAVRVVIDYVFQSLGFKKILAVTHCENLGSTRLLEKLGFIQSGEPDKESPDLHTFTLTQ